MEYIANELKRNGISLNKEVFKDQMNKMKEEYEQRYEEMMKRAEPEDLTVIFHSMNMNSDGRILSFLLLLYYEKQRSVDITEPLRLVANVMKLNLSNVMKLKLEKSRKTLWRRFVPYLGSIITCMFTHEFVKILLLCAFLHTF